MIGRRLLLLRERLIGAILGSSILELRQEATRMGRRREVDGEIKQISKSAEQATKIFSLIFFVYCVLTAILTHHRIVTRTNIPQLIIGILLFLFSFFVVGMIPLIIYFLKNSPRGQKIQDLLSVEAECPVCRVSLDLGGRDKS